MLRIFSGQANEPFAQAIVGCIASQKLGSMHFRRFSDEEFKIRFEESIRGQELFLIQSTNPPADNLFELLMMIDAAKRAGVHRMYIVMPYMGYMRQDKKEKPREPITARLVADLIDAAAGRVPYHVITADMHSDQQEGYYESITPLKAMPFVVNYFKSYFSLSDLAVCAPDRNAAKDGGEFAERMGNLPLIIIDKRRPEDNVSEVIHVLGNAKGKKVILFDDMADTVGTIIGAADALFEQGALDVYAFCTHGVFSGPAMSRMRESKIKKVFITDTMYQDPKKLRRAGKGKLEVISIAPLFADAIMRMHDRRSVSELFE